MTNVNHAGERKNNVLEAMVADINIGTWQQSLNQTYTVQRSTIPASFAFQRAADDGGLR
jgi:hypothetical protein